MSAESMPEKLEMKVLVSKLSAFLIAARGDYNR